jgi:hypothetical protein
MRIVLVMVMPGEMRDNGGLWDYQHVSARSLTQLPLVQGAVSIERFYYPAI